MPCWKSSSDATSRPSAFCKGLLVQCRNGLRSARKRTRDRRPHRSARSPWQMSQAGRAAQAVRHAALPEPRGPTVASRQRSVGPRRPPRLRAPPSSAPRRRAARRPCARRSRPRSRGTAALLPAIRSTSAVPSRRPSRFRVSVVTCAWPIQGGWNSGRKVTTSSTGRRRTRSTARSSSSSEVGSIQCTSSNTISTGRCRARASSCRSSASNVFSFFRCGRQVERRVAVSGGQRQQLGQERHVIFAAATSGEQRLELVELALGRVRRARTRPRVRAAR